MQSERMVAKKAREVILQAHSASQASGNMRTKAGSRRGSIEMTPHPDTPVLSASEGEPLLGGHEI